MGPVLAGRLRAGADPADASVCEDGGDEHPVRTGLRHGRELAALGVRRARLRRAGRAQLVRAAAVHRAGAAAGQRAAAGAAGVRPAPRARPAHARSNGCAASPRSTPTSSSTPATTSPHLDAVPALLRAMEPLLDVPGRVRHGVQRLLRAESEEPGALPHPRHAEAPPGRDPRRSSDLRRGLCAPAAGSTSTTRARPSLGGRAEVELVGVDDPHIELRPVCRRAGPGRPPPLPDDRA